MSATLGLVLSDLKESDVLLRQTAHGWETRLTDFDQPYAFVLRDSTISTRMMMTLIPLTLQECLNECARDAPHRNLPHGNLAFSRSLAEAVYGVMQQPNIREAFQRDLQLKGRQRDYQLFVWGRRLNLVRIDVKATLRHVGLVNHSHKHPGAQEVRKCWRGEDACSAVWDWPNLVNEPPAPGSLPLLPPLPPLPPAAPANKAGN